MYDAAKALKEAMVELGLACDGGKDSLSMAANVAGEVIHMNEPKSNILTNQFCGCSPPAMHQCMQQFYTISMPSGLLCEEDSVHLLAHCLKAFMKPLATSA